MNKLGLRAEIDESHWRGFSWNRAGRCARGAVRSFDVGDKLLGYKG